MTDEPREPTVYSIELKRSLPFFRVTRREERKTEALMSAVLHLAVFLVLVAEAWNEPVVNVTVVVLSIVALLVGYGFVEDTRRWYRWDHLYDRPS